MLLIPMKFVLGAAVGACSTYLYKDEKAREWVQGATGKCKSGLGSLFSRKKATEEISQETAGSVVEAVPGEEVVEAAVAAK